MSEKKSVIRRAFGFLWGAVVTLYRILIILSVIVSITLLWLALRGGRPLVVEDNVALVLAPTGVLMEQVDEDPTQKFFENLAGEAPSQSDLRELIRALEAAREDDRIAFAVLKLDGLWEAGMAQLDELRTAMAAFQASGKKIVAWGPWYDQIHYYAAAMADEVVVDPFGIVYVEGFSLYNNYFREGLDKLGVDINVFRVGEYKAAVEPFTRNDMSAEARAANLDWLGDLWTAYDAAVAQGRALPVGAAQSYVREMPAGMVAAGGDAAAYARERGLVTHVETLADFRKRMGEIVGIDEEHGSFRQIHYREYLAASDRELRAREAAPEPARKIALVVVQGEIVDGGGDIGQAGGEAVAELLDEARLDPDVAAVLLRIDSPGGSVWASEQIRRGVRQLQADGKPVVASMSSVAASGGYWVAMDADQIWAHETTITGSIGVFGLIPTLDRSLAKLGVHTDGVGTTELAGAFRLDRPLTPGARAIIQTSIEKVYRDFIAGVAAGRELSVEQVETLARGRVWSGADAHRLGLVDEIGGLQQAADAAAALAGLEPDQYRLEAREPDRGFAARLMEQFSGQLGALGLRSAGLPQNWLSGLEALRARSEVQRLIAALNDPRGIYAHCYCVPSASRSR